MIGLVPYSFRYESQAAFSIYPRNLHFLLGLGTPPESEHDKLLLSLISSRVKTFFETTTEKNVDINRKSAYEASMHWLVNWEGAVAAHNKPFRQETFDKNLKALEDYIQLCLSHGAKPIGVVWPLNPKVRRHYPQEMLQHFRMTMRMLENSYDFKMIDLFDLPLGFDCFTDLSHCNEKGSIAVSSALNERLHELKILPLNKTPV